MLIRFVCDFGLPWLGFRRSIREGDATSIDFMYATILPWFRATGKWQYARICIDYVWVLHSIHGTVREIWEKYRTCSLLGNPGRDVAWDQANEFMNKDVKEGEPSSPSAIDAHICILNGVKNIEGHLREALGEPREGPSEYTPVKENHVRAIVDALKQHLGSNLEELFGDERKKKSPFGGGQRPWLRTENPGNLHSGSTFLEKHTEAVEWVMQHFETNPFPS